MMGVGTLILRPPPQTAERTSSDMKLRSTTALLFALLSSLFLCLLSGCSLLPPLSPEPAEDTALTLRLGSALPEDIVLSWDPAAVTVDRAEVSVTEDSPGLPRTVTVTIQLSPGQP